MGIRVSRFDVSFAEPVIAEYRPAGFIGSILHKISGGLAIIRETGICDGDQATIDAVTAGMGDPTVTTEIDANIRGESYLNCYLASARFPGASDTPDAGECIPFERVWVQLAAVPGS